MKRNYPRTKKKGAGAVQRFFHAPNPFARLSDAQRQTFNREFTARQEAEYTQSFAELQRLLHEVDAIQTLAHFAFYDLTVFEAYPDVKSDYKGVGQHHVELLQALFLSQPKEERTFTPQQQTLL